jgi:site-specific DNA recombinase
MRVGIYARVSTEGQADRGTIGSQLDALRQAINEEGAVQAGEYIDEGYSGARLDRPGLDAMRDAAEAGLIDQVWCLTPDRLSRSYAYQVLISDELARHGVTIRYLDAPNLDSDPQARLLTQIQSVIAEYERAKISERSRRGKLFRARAGEAVHRHAPYGYIRVPRQGDRPAHLTIHQPQAAIIRRIFADYTTGGLSLKKIADTLTAEGIPSPGGSRWLSSTLSRLLQQPAYVGRSVVNTHQMIHDRGTGLKPRQIRRPKEEWITIACPAIIDETTFAAAGQACAQNTNFAARRLNPNEEAFLLRGLVFCSCGTRTIIHRGRSKRAVTDQLYYRCRDKDGTSSRPPLGCHERTVRAQALDDFVFSELTKALRSPQLLQAGGQSIASRTPAPDDQLLAAELDRLDRRIDSTQTERRRIADMYQAGIIDANELSRRANDIDKRSKELTQARDNLVAQRRQLTVDNQLRHRVNDFAARVADGIERLNFHQQQRLVRLLIERVQVNGWQVEIHLRVPLDPPPPNDPPPRPRQPKSPVATRKTAQGINTSRNQAREMSTEDRLRSIGHRRRIPVIQEVGGCFFSAEEHVLAVVGSQPERLAGQIDGGDNGPLGGDQAAVRPSRQGDNAVAGSVGVAAGAG